MGGVGSKNAPSMHHDARSFETDKIPFTIRVRGRASYAERGTRAVTH